jgi:L-ribulose-5-phosphate 4-epimerase
MHDELRQAVCKANIELQTHRLVICSWGNVSAIDRSAGVVAIKASGVAYDELTPEKIVVLDLEGNVVEVQEFRDDRRRMSHALTQCHNVGPGLSADPLSRHYTRRLLLWPGPGDTNNDTSKNTK